MTTRATLERLARHIAGPEQQHYALHVYTPARALHACPACGSADGTRVTCIPVHEPRDGLRVYVWRCTVCETVSVSERKVGAP